MRQDIYAGLKNALERGASLEQAIRSFVNAGYREAEVRETARALDTGVMPLMQNSFKNPLPPSQISAQGSPAQRAYVPPSFSRQQSSGRGILITVLFIILIISVIAFVFSFIFRKQIAEFVAGLFFALLI